MGDISAQIKSKMEALDISAHGLEKKAGLKPSAVQNILYGRSKNPSIFIVQAIAKALDCSVTDLIGEQKNTGLDQNIIVPIERLGIENGSWNCVLYIDCLKVVSSSLAKKQISSLTKSTILNYVDEAYAYSLKRGTQSADFYFVEWLIEKLG